MSKRYTKDHEWVELDGDVATVGISSYASGELGGVVYAEPPVVGADLTRGATMGVVESAKAASDVYAPISGQVIEVNAELTAKPELIDTSPEGDGWFAKVKVANKADVDALMDEAAYADYVKGL